MLITEISSHISNYSPQDLAQWSIDHVVFDNEQRLKRVQRVSSVNGVEYALRLGTSVREIHDGDTFELPDKTLLVAQMAPTDVLVISPRSVVEALKIAHTLGNRHLQAQFFDEDSQFGAPVMVVRYDHTVEHYLDHVQAAYSRGEFVMPAAFRHAEHSH